MKFLARFLALMALVLLPLSIVGPIAAQTYPTQTPVYIPQALLTTAQSIASTATFPLGTQQFYNNGTVTGYVTIAGTFTGLTATPQCAVNRVTPTWVAVSVTQTGVGRTSFIALAGTYRFRMAGWAICRLNVTALATGSFTNLWSAGPGPVEIDTTFLPKATFSFTTVALAPAASATDIVSLIGSATRTVRIDRICVSARATAVAAYDIVLAKYSTANTGGTHTAPALVPNDTNDPAATAVATAYTANPTLGTLIGNIGVKQLVASNLTTGLGNPPICWDWGTDDRQAPTLRGVAQQLSINLNGVTMSGGLIDVGVEYTEE